MNRQIREPVEELKSAAETLRLDRAMSLAVQAMSAASERGLALAFTRSARTGGFRAALDGEILRPEELDHAAPSWIVDIDAVPQWQRNCWIEPMHAGIHGRAYFSDGHPIRRRLGWRSPDYGRVMVCHGGRLVAWAGLFVDGRYEFRDGERARLREVAQAIALPLKLAALCAATPAGLELSPRQRQIVDGVARGLTNKRIAKDLDISPATVKTVLERLLRISGTANRAALAVWAARESCREM